VQRTPALPIAFYLNVMSITRVRRSTHKKVWLTRN